MDRGELVQVLCYIGGIYRGQFDYPSNVGNVIDDEANDLILEEAWFTFLKPYEIEEVMAATKYVMLEAPRFPPVAAMIIKKLEENRKPPMMNSGQAWEKVLGCARKNGKGFKDLSLILQKAVNAIGGISMICRSNEGDTFIMHGFKTAYKDLCEIVDDHRLKKISGLSEISKQLGNKMKSIPEKVKKIRLNLNDKE